MFRLSPVTKSTASTVRADPSGAQQLVAGLERDRQRDHRAGRQGHADVAADGRRVPDLERGQERLAARREEGARDPIARRRRRHTARGRCTSRRSRGPRRSGRGVPAAAPSGRPGGAGSGCSAENSHVPPASQASPSRQSAPGRSDGRRTTSVMVLRSTGTDLPHDGHRVTDTRRTRPAGSVAPFAFAATSRPPGPYSVGFGSARRRAGGAHRRDGAVGKDTRGAVPRIPVESNAERSHPPREVRRPTGGPGGGARTPESPAVRGVTRGGAVVRPSAYGAERTGDFAGREPRSEE